MDHVRVLFDSRISTLMCRIIRGAIKKKHFPFHLGVFFNFLGTASWSHLPSHHMSFTILMMNILIYLESIQCQYVSHSGLSIQLLNTHRYGMFISIVALYQLVVLPRFKIFHDLVHLGEWYLPVRRRLSLTASVASACMRGDLFSRSLSSIPSNLFLSKKGITSSCSEPYIAP